MSETLATSPPRGPPPPWESIAAWAVNWLACVYCVWVGAFLWRSLGAFGTLILGLAQPPVLLGIVAQQRTWLVPAVFGFLVVALLVKERRIRDKRLSAGCSLVAVVLAMILFQATMTLLYREVFDLMAKLGPS